MKDAQETREDFQHLKKDLLTILIVIVIIVSSFIFLQYWDSKTEIVAKIGQKIGSKYIK